MPRTEGAGIHVVLPELSPNDDVTDFQPGLSRSGDAGEEDFANAEIGNQVRCRGGRGDFAPSRKNHDHGRAPEVTRVISPRVSISSRMAAMIPIGIADVSQFRLATGRAGSR